jgi:hypothetical protein
MKYYFYYYSDEQKCILLKESVKPEKIPQETDAITLHIDTKDIYGIYPFFKKAIFENTLIQPIELIEVIYDNISSEPFFLENAFIKIKELIDKTIIDCNTKIEELIEMLKKEK